jgi:hypothetical protein
MVKIGNLLAHKFWLSSEAMLALMSVLTTAFFVWMILSSQVASGPWRAAEKKFSLEERQIDTSAGRIDVIDLRSGTEINRILLMPDGRMVVESVYINNWGEQQVRLIGKQQ